MCLLAEEPPRLVMTAELSGLLVWNLVLALAAFVAIMRCDAR